MKESAGKAVPANVRFFVITSVFIPAYASLAQAALSDETEVVLSLFGATSAALAAFGSSSRARFVCGSILGFAPGLAASGRLRALLIGATLGYLQTACEIYASNMSVAHYKKEALILARFSTTLLGCISLFSLHFVPWTQRVVLSPTAAFAFPALQILVACFFTVETPVEALKKRRRRPDVAEVLLGRLFQTLSVLYRDAPFASFRTEYRGIVDSASGAARAPPLAAHVSAVAAKVNISFIFFGLQPMLGASKNGPLFVVLISTIQTFCWFLAQEFAECPIEDIFFVVSSILILIISTRNVDAIFVSLLILGFAYIPHEKSFLDLCSTTIAISECIKYALAATMLVAIRRL